MQFSSLAFLTFLLNYHSIHSSVIQCNNSDIIKEHLTISFPPGDCILLDATNPQDIKVIDADNQAMNPDTTNDQSFFVPSLSSFHGTTQVTNKSINYIFAPISDGQNRITFCSYYSCITLLRPTSTFSISLHNLPCPSGPKLLLEPSSEQQMLCISPLSQDEVTTLPTFSIPTSTSPHQLFFLDSLRETLYFKLHFHINPNHNHSPPQAPSETLHKGVLSYPSPQVTLTSYSNDPESPTENLRMQFFDLTLFTSYPRYAFRKEFRTSQSDRPLPVNSFIIRTESRSFLYDSTSNPPTLTSLGRYHHGSVALSFEFNSPIDAFLAGLSFDLSPDELTEMQIFPPEDDIIASEKEAYATERAFLKHVKQFYIRNAMLFSLDIRGMTQEMYNSIKTAIHGLMRIFDPKRSEELPELLFTETPANEGGYSIRMEFLELLRQCLNGEGQFSPYKEWPLGRSRWETLEQLEDVLLQLPSSQGLAKFRTVDERADLYAERRKAGRRQWDLCSEQKDREDGGVKEVVTGKGGEENVGKEMGGGDKKAGGGEEKNMGRGDDEKIKDEDGKNKEEGGAGKREEGDKKDLLVLGLKIGAVVFVLLVIMVLVASKRGRKAEHGEPQGKGLNETLV